MHGPNIMIQVYLNWLEASKYVFFFCEVRHELS